MKFKSSIARAAMTALFLGASAQATILNEFSDVGAWTLATTGTVTNQPFTSLSGSAASLTFGSVTYAGFYNENSSGGNETFAWANPDSSVQTGSGAFLMGGSIFGIVNGNNTNNTGIRATLNSLSGITALAFNFSAYRLNQSTGAIIYSDGSATSLNNVNIEVYENGLPSPAVTRVVPLGSTGALALGFYGVTTTGNITGVKIYIDAPSNTVNSRVVLDNFAYAAAAVQSGGGGGSTGGEIPEPTTYLLCAAGLFGVALLRRPKSKQI